MKRYFFALTFTAAFCIAVLSTAASAQTSKDHFDRGLEAFRAGNLTLAITEYTSAIQLNPKGYNIYFNRALAHEKNNSPDLAIHDYTKAIELKPDFRSAFVNRANIYGKRGDLEFALADYNKAIELDPKNARAYFNRGSTYRHKRMLAEAMADYDKSIELDPKYANAYHMRGNVHSQNKNWGLAIRDWERAVELDPSLTELHYQTAWTHLIANNNEQAYASAVKYVDAVGMKQNQSGWGLIAGYLALLRAGKHSEAEAFISRYPREEAPGVFPVKVLEFLRGRLTEPELLAAAGDDKLKKMAAHTYIGQMQLLNGKKAAAAESFNLASKVGARNATEYQIALAELERFSAK